MASSDLDFLYPICLNWIEAVHHRDHKLARTLASTIDQRAVAAGWSCSTGASYTEALTSLFRFEAARATGSFYAGS